MLHIAFYQNMGGGQRPMTAQIDSNDRPEPAKKEAFPLSIQKSGFREIHLLCYQLHPSRVSWPRQDAHSRSAAHERLIGEGVYLNKFQCHDLTVGNSPGPSIKRMRR